MHKNVLRSKFTFMNKSIHYCIWILIYSAVAFLIPLLSFSVFPAFFLFSLSLSLFGKHAFPSCVFSPHSEGSGQARLTAGQTLWSQSTGTWRAARPGLFLCKHAQVWGLMAGPLMCVCVCVCWRGGHSRRRHKGWVFPLKLCQHRMHGSVCGMGVGRGPFATITGSL